MMSCGSGYRSAFATDTLTKMGYTNVKNYKAGFLGLEGEAYPAKYK
jgi:rhodanese-related sulfurtransferase